MKKIIPVTLFFTLLLLACCTENNEHLTDKQREAKETSEAITLIRADIDSLDFTIDLPDYMTTTSRLVPNLPFQYMNGKEEQYITVFLEDKVLAKASLKILGSDENKSFVENYMDFFTKQIQQNMTIKSTEKPKKTAISGMNAQQLNFVGRVPALPIDIAYFTTYIEGKENVYAITVWTLETKKEGFTPLADKIIRTFRLKS